MLGVPLYPVATIPFFLELISCQQRSSIFIVCISAAKYTHTHTPLGQTFFNRCTHSSGVLLYIVRKTLKKKAKMVSQICYRHEITLFFFVVHTKENELLFTLVFLSFLHMFTLRRVVYVATLLLQCFCSFLSLVLIYLICCRFALSLAHQLQTDPAGVPPPVHTSFKGTVGNDMRRWK